MRIIEPKSKSKIESKKSPVIKYIFILFLSLIFILIYRSLFISSNTENNQISIPEETSESDNIDVDLVSEGPILLSGNEFRLLYDNLVLPNTQKINTPPVISGNDVADARIRLLAETRGYKIRSTISNDIPVVDGHKLQESVKVPWKNMQADAANDGHIISIVSGYRSIEAQKALFVERLIDEGVSLVDVANGLADDEITKVLTTTSIPGYSKHHSGYTVDFLCSGWSFDDFYKSNCNDWLVSNNYENAKKYGFIPSYPLDADLQGPEPEAWEYVYVGTETLNP